VDVFFLKHGVFAHQISMHGWDKTTSGFGKRKVAILELYIWFRFWPVCSYRDIILHPPAKFCSNPTIGGGVMTSYRFFKMAAGSHIGFDLDNIRPPTKCNCWSEVGPQIWSWSDL